MADPASLALWETLSLGYTESQGFQLAVRRQRFEVFRQLPATARRGPPVP